MGVALIVALLVVNLLASCFWVGRIDRLVLLHGDNEIASDACLFDKVPLELARVALLDLLFDADCVLVISSASAIANSAKVFSFSVTSVFSNFFSRAKCAHLFKSNINKKVSKGSNL